MSTPIVVWVLILGCLHYSSSNSNYHRTSIVSAFSVTSSISSRSNIVKDMSLFRNNGDLFQPSMLLQKHQHHDPHDVRFKTSTCVSSSNSDGDNNNNKNEYEYIEKLQDESFIRRNKQWVILVDDEEAIRLAVGDYLYDSGYQVTACADVDALLEVLHMDNSRSNDKYFNKIPDVIISDIRMPGKDGLELVKLIRSDERLSRTPIILLTAKSLTQDRILGYQAGADVYLPKPFDPEELLSIVDNAIVRNRQMTGERGQFMDLKEEVTDIKEILKKNARSVVKETDVYLTPTEREVLELLCKGFSNLEIAEERKVSKVNVNRYVQNLYIKTGTRTRTELVRWAIKTGQIARN